MLRVLFFFMGVPMMIVSFFQATQALPYATDYSVYVNGNVVEISEADKEVIKEKVEAIFENSHTLPAFAVTTDEIFHEQIKDGIFVSIKFDNVLHINELPFDELVFKVEKDTHGFNLFRGMNGIFQGRCIYIDMMDGNMNDLYDFLTKFDKEESLEQESEEEQLPSGDGSVVEEEKSDLSNGEVLQSEE